MKSLIPKQIKNGTRQDLEKLGFVFGEEANDLFIHVVLPDGWRVTPPRNRLHTDIVDDTKRIRCTMTYKDDGFYGEIAFMKLVPRYGYRLKSKRNKVVWVCTDGMKKKIHKGSIPYTPSSNVSDQFEAEFLAMTYAEQWLDEHYPDWRDPSAYWD